MSMSSDSIPNARWLHIIPPCIIIYIVSFMDRTNIGFAIAGGMDKELGLTATYSGIAAGIFFFGYLFLQVFGGTMATKGKGKVFITVSILAWGGISILNGFVQNVEQLMVVRFLLGVAEGGVWPCILAMLANWFPKKELGRANAYFIMNIAIASIITGPISGWIISAFTWRHVFVLEGLLSVLLIAIWVPLMSEGPKEAKWISEEERDYLLRTIAEEQATIQKQSSVTFTKILSTPRVWWLIGIYFFYQVGIYGFAMWLPTLLKQLTGAGIAGIGMLSAAPYIVMIAGLWYFGKMADQTLNRRKYTAIPQMGFAICLVLSVLLKEQIWVSFFFLAACGFFMQSASSVFWTIPPLLFPADFAGGARGCINAVGSLGGFFGPYLFGFLTTSSNQTVATFALVGSLCIGFLLTIFLPTITAGQQDKFGDIVKTHPQ